MQAPSRGARCLAEMKGRGRTGRVEHVNGRPLRLRASPCAHRQPRPRPDTRQVGLAQEHAHTRPPLDPGACSTQQDMPEGMPGAAHADATSPTFRSQAPHPSRPLLSRAADLTSPLQKRLRLALLVQYKMSPHPPPGVRSKAKCFHHRILPFLASWILPTECWSLTVIRLSTHSYARFA